MKQRLKNITHSWGGPAILLALLIIANALTYSTFFRIDLTKDKRYTLAGVSKEYLRNLEQKVTVRIYLAGDLNPGFKRLHQSVRDMLTEFSVYGGENIEFSFPEPEKITDKEEYERLEAEIRELGLNPINVFDEGPKGEKIQVPVFPWAVFETNGKRFPVRLLVNIPGKSGGENLNASIETLEYSLMDGIRIVSSKGIRKIAFLEGHNELPEEEVYDITEALSRYFQVDRGAIGTDTEILNGYELLIVAQPKEPFTEQEKFVIDQYVMQGGKLLWLVEGVGISIDSLSHGAQTIGVYNNLNLEDLLFNYGVRVNPTLVQDLQCALYPVNFAQAGEKANFRPVPWYYSPLLFSHGQHPVTRGLSPVKSEFCSSLDSVGGAALKKTPLLVTSGRSNVFQAPAPVNLELSAANLNPEDFTLGPQVIAYLVEGSFQSVFRNRFVPRGINVSEADIKTYSEHTSMIVIGDGDIIRNEVEGHEGNRRIYPLGYDRLTSQNMFSNRDFLLNCVNYLTDDEGWMTLRSKKIPLRLLSKAEANDKRVKWQLINVLSPVLLLLFGGLVFTGLRKRRYSG